MLIHNEDCVVTMRDRLAPESVDLIVTSPPYDGLRTYKGYSFDFESVAKGIQKVLAPGGVVVWIVQDMCVKGSKSGTSFRQALYFQEIGLGIHDVMIWQKPCYAPLYPSVKRYDQVFEYMLILSKGQPKTWNPIKDKPRVERGSSRISHFTQKDGTKIIKELKRPEGEFCKRTSVWTIQNGTKRGLSHPAPFPEALVHDHVVTWSNPGDLVYDPFLGSGTTGVVCEKLGRRWVGSEVSSDYCAAAQQRIENK